MQESIWDSVSRKLWSGSWGSGSITVPGLSGYTLLGARVEGSNMMMIAFRPKGFPSARFGMIHVSSTPNMFNYCADCSVSGDVLTLNEARYVNVNGETLVKIKISEVWGIV